MKPTSLTQEEMREALSNIPATHRVRYEMPGGGALDFTSLGGMPIGWFLDSGDKNAQNVFWNPMKGFEKVLRQAYDVDVQKLASYIKGPWNIGGGPTLWVGPEFGSPECYGKTRFCRKPGDYRTWECQPGMGLTGFSVAPLPKEVKFFKKADLREYLKDELNEFRFSRDFSIEEPSKKPGDGIKHASALGFKDVVSSETANDHQVWDLLRLPVGTKKDAATVVFPASEPGLSVYMAKGHGKRFDDYVIFSEDQTSLKVRYIKGSVHKLALPPSCMRMVNGCGVIMYVTPLENGNHRLLVAKFKNIPRKDEDILEVSSLPEKYRRNLPRKMAHGRGALFNYLGISPTDPEDFFTEVEGLGSRPCDYIFSPGSALPSPGYVSVLEGRIEAYEGDRPALTRLVGEFGAISRPYLFD